MNGERLHIKDAYQDDWRPDPDHTMLIVRFILIKPAKHTPASGANWFGSRVDHPWLDTPHRVVRQFPRTIISMQSVYCSIIRPSWMT